MKPLKLPKPRKWPALRVGTLAVGSFLFGWGIYGAIWASDALANSGTHGNDLESVGATSMAYAIGGIIFGAWLSVIAIRWMAPDGFRETGDFINGPESS